MIKYNANTQFPYTFSSSNTLNLLCFDVPKAPTDTVLEYTLDKLDHALLFQIHYQHPAVAAILEKGNFMAKNGMIISMSKRPELKDSLNTIYLRGSDKSNDNKPDVTTFTHNFKRDNRYNLVREAIKEFADYVRKSYSFTRYLSPVTYFLF